MSINRIDFGVIANTSEISNIKSTEEARPLTNQQNFQTIFNHEIDEKQHSINTKDDAPKGNLNSDAKEKGKNEYQGDGGKNRKKNSFSESNLSAQQLKRMAGTMLDKNGKPIDLEISTGIDLKI